MRYVSKFVKKCLVAFSNISAVKSTSALGVTAFIVLLSGCTEPTQVNEAEEPSVRPAKIAQVLASGGDTLKTFPATVEPSLYAHLAFRVNGEINSLPVVAGNTVKKGQTLAELDNRDFVVQQKQAKAKFDLTASQFKRAQQLIKENLISSSEFDQLKAEVDIAEAQLDAATNNLAYSTLKAPFDGVISNINVESFEFIQAKQPIMEIQGRNKIDVAIQVPEQLMVQLPTTNKTESYKPNLIFDAAPDKKYQVSLKEHDISPNSATKSYTVIFTLPTPQDINVLPGMTGTLEVELNKLLNTDESLLVVPISSVFVPNEHASSQTKFVYKVLANMSTKLVAIEVIETKQKGLIVRPAIQGELTSSDKVIAAGPHLIPEGTVVSEWVQERGL